MAVCRLRAIAQNRAFTLSETVIALLIISLAAAMLLISVSISANYIRLGNELHSNMDSAAVSLYRGEAECLSVKPPVRLVTESGYSYENVDGEDGAELPALAVYSSVVEGTDITLYYFGGGYAKETVQ